MQLGYTILYVPDEPATLKFYEAAFGLTTRFLHESGDYGQLETGRTALAISAHSLMRQLGKNPQTASPTAPCFEIALCTPGVAAALDRAIASGATPMRQLEVMPWGHTITYVADINGFIVELCTNQHEKSDRPCTKSSAPTAAKSSNSTKLATPISRSKFATVRSSSNCMRG